MLQINGGFQPVLSRNISDDNGTRGGVLGDDSDAISDDDDVYGEEYEIADDDDDRDGKNVASPKNDFTDEDSDVQVQKST